jgi:cytidylate kinase
MPTTDLVCISRPVGAGGEAVGRLVAEKLGFRYVDEEIVERAAAKLDVPVDLVADAESRRSLTRRVLEELMRDASGISLMSGGVPTPSEARSSEDYRALIEQVVRETAEEGQVVIVAHAASIPLAGRPGLVRVLVTASPDVRADRLSGELDLKDSEAKKLVKESDLARTDYLKRFYGVKEEIPTLYDLVVNTDILAPELAATLVLAATAE